MFVPLTPLRCLHRAIDVFGSKTGIVSGDRSFTYAQFGERCEKLATGLPKFGIRPGDRVAYLSFNTHQLIEGYYGVVQARGIVMPLNVRLSEVELTSILCHSGARMLMFEDDFAPMVEKLRKSCPAVEKWVALDGQGDLSYEEILDAGPIFSPTTKCRWPSFSIPAAAPERPRASRWRTAPSICTRWTSAPS
jgi:fatty-acyl-CoA synthase